MVAKKKYLLFLWLQLVPGSLRPLAQTFYPTPSSDWSHLNILQVSFWTSHDRFLLGQLRSFSSWTKSPWEKGTILALRQLTRWQFVPNNTSPFYEKRQHTGGSWELASLLGHRELRSWFLGYQEVNYVTVCREVTRTTKRQYNNSLKMCQWWKSKERKWLH